MFVSAVFLCRAGNGILDERELKIGLEQLGVDVSNDSMVT